MKSLRPALLLLSLGLAGALRAEEPGKLEKAKEAIKETAEEAAAATKRAAQATKEKTVELYDKTAEGAKHAAAVTKEKSKEAYEATKEAAAKAKDKTVATSKVVAEKTKEAALATKEKALELTTTKEELARYDRNHDGKLDEAERARMKADEKKP